MGPKIYHEWLRPFRHVRLRRYLCAQFSSQLGGAIAPIALVFAVLDLDHSASTLGIVLASRTIPMILLTLYGGVIADRFPRHIVLIVANIVGFLTQGIVAVLLLTGAASVWQLMLIEAINGAAAAFVFPAMQGLIPSLVPRELIQPANALRGLIDNVTVVGGTSLAGLIVGLMGPGWGMSVSSVCLAVAAVLLSRLGATSVPMSPPRASLVDDLKHGWREFVDRRWALSVVLSFTILNTILAGTWYTLGPVIADRSFGREAWGVILGVQALGLIAGSIALVRIRVRRPLAWGMLGMLLGVPLLLILGLRPSIGAMAGAALVSGLGFAVFGVLWESTLQANVPQQSLSRVASYDAFGSLAATPVGQILAGPMAAFFGLGQVVVAGAILYALVICAALLYRPVRSMTTDGSSGGGSADLTVVEGETRP